MLSALVLTTSTICTDSVNAAANAPVKPAPQTQQKVTQPQAVPVSVDALTVVNTPKAYLNKNIILNEKFDKFSTLGLDYKPAYKSSEDYISFLIKRPDTNFDIPLSEMNILSSGMSFLKLVELLESTVKSLRFLLFTPMILALALRAILTSSSSWVSTIALIPNSSQIPRYSLICSSERMEQMRSIARAPSVLAS